MRRTDRIGITSKKDYYRGIILIAYIAALILRIPLGYLIGNKGIAYFSLANENYFVLAGFFSYGLSEAVASLVRYRIRREQYKSAQRVLSGALLVGGIIGFLLSFLFGFFGGIVADKLFAMPLAGLSVRLMAPSIFFYILAGAFRGYFQGNGSKMPAVHSQVLHAVVLAAGCLMGGTILHDYGEKVSALLQNPDHAGAYGAMGASLGFLAASVLCFLHMVVLYLIFVRKVKRQLSRELQKNQDTGFYILRMLTGAGVIHAAYYLVFTCLPLVDLGLWFRLGMAEGDPAGQWGNYYGRYLVITGIVNYVLYFLCLTPARRIVSFVDREEYRMARGRLGELIHWCAAVTIPAAIFMAVLAENILNLFFEGNNQQTATWIQWGSVGTIFFVLSVVFMEILVKGNRQNLTVIAGGSALLLHIGFVAALLSGTQLGIVSLVMGGVLFYAIVAVSGFFMVGRRLQYRQEWIKSFAVTIIAAAISGVIVMLLNRVFSPMLGTSISLLICLSLGVVIYILLLLAARGFKEEELENSAFGRLLIVLARKLHFME